MIHPFKLAHSSAKHRCGKRKFCYRGINLIDQNGQKPTSYTCSTIRISLAAGFQDTAQSRMPATNEVQQETIELSSPKAQHEQTWQQTVGRRSQDRFHLSSERSLHEGRSHHRQVTGVEEGVAQRTSLRNADAYLFHDRAGRGLSPSRRRVLERAKRILSQPTER